MQPKKSYFKDYLALFRFLNWKAGVMLLCSIYTSCYRIFVVQITAGIIGTIENADTEKLRFLVKVFIALMVLNYLAELLDNLCDDVIINDMR